LNQLDSRLRPFTPGNGQRVQDPAILSTFRDRFFRPFASVNYRPFSEFRPSLYFTISLFVIAVTGASFLVLASEVSQRDWLVRFDHSLCTSLHEHSSVNAVRIFRLVSVFGDVSTLASLSLLFVIALIQAAAPGTESLRVHFDVTLRENKYAVLSSATTIQGRLKP
jgi:hypothetical protein